MRGCRFHGMVLAFFLVIVVSPLRIAQAKSYLAYISDSPSPAAAYWVAHEMGLFKKHGSDLELIYISGSVRGIQSLIAGDLSFSGAVGTAVINARLAGGEVAIINSLANTLPYFIIGKPDIQSAEELKGKSAAVHIPGTSADFALRLALLKVGILYKDIKAVTVGGGPARIAAVKSGQLDFTVVTEPEKIQGEKAGLKVILDMAKLNVPFQFSCTVATRKKIREKPEEVRGLVKAMAEAVHAYKTNKEETIKIMGKYTRGLNRGVLEGAYAAYKDLLVEDTYPTLEGLKTTLEAQSSWDAKAAQAKIEDFVDLRFVDELKKTGFLDQLYGRR